MPTAKKLPSGSWRCLVYSHTEEITNPDGSVKRNASMNRLRAIYRGQKASVSQNRRQQSLLQIRINAAILQICFWELLWIITYNPENLFCHHVQLWTTNESEERRCSL